MIHVNTKWTEIIFFLKLSLIVSLCLMSWKLNTDKYDW